MMENLLGYYSRQLLYNCVIFTRLHCCSLLNQAPTVSSFIVLVLLVPVANKIRGLP